MLERSSREKGCSGIARIPLILYYTTVLKHRCRVMAPSRSAQIKMTHFRKEHPGLRGQLGAEALGCAVARICKTSKLTSTNPTCSNLNPKTQRHKDSDFQKYFVRKFQNFRGADLPCINIFYLLIMRTTSHSRSATCALTGRCSELTNRCAAAGGA